MTPYLLQVESLSKTVGSHPLVTDVTFHVHPGDVLAIVGQNGAGKTTLLRMICGFIQPSQGLIRIKGHSVRDSFTEAIRHLGAFIETPAFHGHLSAYDNLRLTAKILGLPCTRIDEALETVGLADTGKKKVRTFSLGMRQRLGIAHAILGNPPRLILDEPTNGLDPQGIIDMRHLIRNLQSRGFTILVASHLLTEVEQVATRIALMNKGRIIMTGSVEDLLQTADNWSYHIKVEPEITLLKWQTLFPAFTPAQMLEHGKIEVRLEQEDLPEIVQILVKNGYTIKELMHKSRSLEEAFLDYLEVANQ